MNFAKFLRTPFLQSTSRRLVLYKHINFKECVKRDNKFNLPNVEIHTRHFLIRACYFDTNTIYSGQLIANDFWKIYWNVSSLLEYFSIYYETLRLYNITNFFKSNLVWFELAIFLEVFGENVFFYWC